jgi:glycosyltransferase involved in cell wall biosynthesis
VRNDPRQLRVCIERLFTSSYPAFEVIVVDDASTDETAAVAVGSPVRVLHLEKCCGPAVARNRGAELARGEYILFLDADVCVSPDTLQHVADTFARDPGLDAVFGSYDTKPGAGNVLSQFKNLFHHFVHQDSCEEATTFWSGCGAVRRSVFSSIGGFSASYGRPAIEDIELGRRLHKANHRIMLNKAVQVTHLKRWTLWSMVKSDVFDRGIPWTELMLREGQIPNDLNLKYSQRISVVLAYALLAVFGIGVWHYQHLLVVPVSVLALICALDYWSTRRHYSTVVRLLVGSTGIGTLAVICYIFKYWPLVPLALAVSIIGLNWRFYLFFWRERHLLLLVLVLPLHVLYYLYSGFAFASGATLHFARSCSRALRRAASWGGVPDSGAPAGVQLQVAEPSDV